MAKRKKEKNTVLRPVARGEVVRQEGEKTLSCFQKFRGGMANTA
jgi:hypothetical protein